MPDQRRKLVKLLRLEIEEILDTLADAESLSAVRREREEITEYVFKENGALYHLEEESLRRLLGSVDAFDFSLYTDVAETSRALERMVREHVKDREEPEAVHRFVAAKIAKALNYVNAGDNP